LIFEKDLIYMADEPKAPRKRAAKKAVDGENKKVSKKAAVVPVPLFQAAPTTKSVKSAKAAKDEKPAPVLATGGDESEKEEFRRRRRRGGRGRRRGGKELSESDENIATPALDETTDSEGVTHKRRRRRRARGEGVTPGETIEEDGVLTVVKVRPVRVREARTEPRKFERRDRNRFDRPDRRERRDFTRKRGTVITESEFLARREAVDRSMLVRQIADRTQIAIIEDDVMVEHYVNRNSNISYVGNVYLGKVQNVLPSMEAAFVDIGKGRNAVLYAGEVNWDAHGLSDTAPRKIEQVL
jgi:ribonuclease E